MSPPSDIGAHLRRLFGDLNTQALGLSAELLTAATSARDVLAPVADEESPAGIAAGIAHQILADVVAGALCPLSSEPNP